MSTKPIALDHRIGSAIWAGICRLGQRTSSTGADNNLRTRACTRWSNDLRVTRHTVALTASTSPSLMTFSP